MRFVNLRRKTVGVKTYPELGHGYTVVKLTAGDVVDVTRLRQFERDEDGEDWGPDAPPKAMLLSGIGIVSTPLDAHVVIPEYGDFRCGVNGIGTTKLEALTDLTYVCFSPLNKEAYEMYKLTPKVVDAPFQVSGADGLYLVVINGTADIGGVEHSAGAKIVLNESVITVTPVGTAQCMLISDRNAPVVVEVVPRSVSPRQIRQALTQLGMRASVEDAVAAGSQDLKDWWEFATLIERNNAQVVAMGTGLGQTTEQMDALFTLASTL